MIVGSVTVYAGEWKQDGSGWWYQNDDGGYSTNSWQWIDGDNDGIAENYYFDSSGYLLVNATTPDGYQVNENGAWIKDGIVQIKSYAEVIALSNYPDTGISLEDIRTALLQGKEDSNDIVRYMRVSELVDEKIGELVNALTNKNTIELQKIVSELENMDFNIYKNFDSLYVKRQSALDEWFVNIMLQYYKEYMLANEKSDFEERNFISDKIIAVLTKRADDYKEIIIFARSMQVLTRE